MKTSTMMTLTDHPVRYRLATLFELPDEQILCMSDGDWYALANRAGCRNPPEEDLRRCLQWAQHDYLLMKGELREAKYQRDIAREKARGALKGQSAHPAWVSEIWSDRSPPSLEGTSMKVRFENEASR